MADVKKGGIVAAAKESGVVATGAAQQTVAAVFNSLLDKENYRTRLNDLLKERAPQFMASIVELVNSSPELQKVFASAPHTIIRSALRAASYDLPIDAGMGYAYILPFNNKQKDGSYRYEAQFIMGYRGMLQLAIRTGVYQKINVVDVREGELIKYDRLTEDVEVNFIEDEDVRNAKPIVGFLGYYRLVNGMEKTIYMSRKAIDAQEVKNRKGKFMNPVWKNDWESMAAKTVLRKLIGKWGIMSVNYRPASPDMLALAEKVAHEGFDDEDVPTVTQTVKVAYEEVPQEQPEQEQAPDIPFGDAPTEDERKQLIEDAFGVAADKSK